MLLSGRGGGSVRGLPSGVGSGTAVLGSGCTGATRGGGGLPQLVP
jgi:hypothetical protein